MKQYTVNNDNAGQRLNKYCGRILGNAPQSFIYKMLRKKNITLNGKKADGNELLREGDIVKFFLADETFEKFSQVVILVNSAQNKLPDNNVQSLGSDEIVYEDENILVCYKPEGELSQKARPEDCSINERIVKYLTNKNNVDKDVKFVPGICNRLDRNTKGLITAGKNLKSQRFLSDLFRERKIDKYYIAVVSGNLVGRVDSKLFICKDEKNNKSEISSVKKEGYNLIHSIFYGLVSNGRYSIVKVKLKTGKSHQIRAQLAYMGSPIIGDSKYGDKAVNGIVASKYEIRTQMLLAYELVFPECTGDFAKLSKKEIKCKIPYEFKAFWEENRLWAHGNPEDLGVHF
ncbi:MAG: RluA family pseudouridine synthase [Lachnospiraceae bacterium]|nr:RluA family pseudouridine synthase [Lachnospiraceae bacterium]